MLFESRHVRVTVDHGAATLWFGFPDEPVNALDLTRLREIDEALRVIAASPYVQVLCVRSANRAGFCAGIRQPALASLVRSADRAAFAWYGQQVFDRLAGLPAVSLALIDGPCLGAGFELALACDYRLCVARSTTCIGFPERFACFGGTSRLRHLGGRRSVKLIESGEILSGREARDRGLVDLACCERRTKIDLRSFLDHLERRPLKRHRLSHAEGHADERRALAGVKSQAAPETQRLPERLNPVPPFPEIVGLLGNDPNAGQLAAELALRGGSVIVCGDRSHVFAGITIAQNRGFVTKLEAEEAWRRVRTSDTLEGFDRAGLVFVAEGQDPFRLAASVLPRTLVCVIRPKKLGVLERPRHTAMPFPFPRRLLHVSFLEQNRLAFFPEPTTDPELPGVLGLWLRPFGFKSVVFPVAAQLLPRVA